jgi:hypothetical protein
MQGEGGGIGGTSTTLRRKAIHDFGRNTTRPLGGPRHRWESNIKVDFKELGYEGVDWIH